MRLIFTFPYQDCNIQDLFGTELSLSEIVVIYLCPVNMTATIPFQQSLLHYWLEIKELAIRLYQPGWTVQKQKYNYI